MAGLPGHPRPRRGPETPRAARRAHSAARRCFNSVRREQMGGLWTGIRPVHLYQTSQMVSKYSGMIIQPNKVGKELCQSAAV